MLRAVLDVLHQFADPCSAISVIQAPFSHCKTGPAALSVRQDMCNDGRGALHARRALLDISSLVRDDQNALDVDMGPFSQTCRRLFATNAAQEQRRRILDGRLYFHVLTAWLELTRLWQGVQCVWDARLDSFRNMMEELLAFHVCQALFRIYRAVLHASFAL